MRLAREPCPWSGPLVTWVGRPKQPHHDSPAGRTRQWAAHRVAGGVVDRLRVAHWVALTVAKLPGPRWKG